MCLALIVVTKLIIFFLNKSVHSRGAFSVEMLHSKWSFALLLLSFSLSKCDAKPLKQPRIVIVGAGLSGVTAAVKLIENGFENVVLFEAENRIGGRIYSVPFANGMIDLGAQWVRIKPE